MSKLDKVIERTLKSFCDFSVYEIPNSFSGLMIKREKGDQIEIYFVKNTLSDNLEKDRIYTGLINRVDVESLKRVIKEKLK